MSSQRLSPSWGLSSLSHSLEVVLR